MSNKAHIVPLEPRENKQQQTQAPAGAHEPDVFQGVVAGMPEKPKGMNKEQSGLWDEMGARLVDLGILSEIDLSIFHRWVVMYSEWRKWNRECQKENGKGAIQVFATGARQMSVEAVLRKQAAEQLNKLENQLGMTVRARQVIKLENPAQGMLDL